jgi:hypothetical protein
MDRSLRDDLLAVCRAIALVLPDDAAFSGPTAAALWGLPLEPPVARAARERPHVTGVDDRPRHASRLVAHAGLRRGERTSRDGVPLTTPVRTWRDLGAVDLSDPTRPTHPAGVDARHGELVVITDALLASDDGYDDQPRYGLFRADLEEALEGWSGVRGVRALRAALADARRFVDSAMETRTRLRAVASGFPCPVVGANLVSPGGLWLARPDMCWPEIGVAIEFDGEHHLDRAQLAHDTARRDAMDAIGWRCVVLYAEDVGHRWPATVRRLRDAFAQQGCDDPGRLTPAPATEARARIVCSTVTGRRRW